MNRTLFLLAGTLLLAFCLTTGTAAAHSTAGRIKIDLDKKQPTTDDFAYFMESYVHRQLYEGKFEKWQKRFYVKDFLKVDQQGDRATVHFLTLDNMEKKDFADSMSFTRGWNGTWHFQPENSSEQIPVYTYVMKWGYYYERYILPGSIAGLAVGVSALGLLVVKRKKNARRQAG